MYLARGHSDSILGDNSVFHESQSWGIFVVAVWTLGQHLPVY
jgi:hypothetical protein